VVKKGGRKKKESHWSEMEGKENPVENREIISNGCWHFLLLLTSMMSD